MDLEVDEEERLARKRLSSFTPSEYVEVDDDVSPESSTFAPSKIINRPSSSTYWKIQTDQGTLEIEDGETIETLGKREFVPKSPSDMVGGEIIIYSLEKGAKPFSQLVRDVLNRKPETIEQAVMASVWTKRFSDWCELHPELDHDDVYQMMCKTEKCTLKSPKALKSWMKGDIIGPRDLTNLKALFIAIGVDDLDPAIHMGYIKRFRRTVIRCHRVMRKKLMEVAPIGLEWEIIEDEIIDEDMDLYLSDFQDIAVFARVLARPQLVS